MFQITGTWNGASVENELISADELIKAFDIPFNKDNDRIRFKLNRESPGIVGKNQATGREKFAGRRTFAPVVSGTYNGNSVQIRYFERRTTQGLGMYKYAPNRIQYRGDIVSFDPRRDLDLEKAIMFYLLGSCKDSPLSKRTDIKVYEFYDMALHARKEIEETMAGTKMVEEIYKMSEEQLLILGRAVNEIKLGVVPESLLSDPTAVKVALIKSCINDLNTIHRAMNSPDKQMIAKVLVYQEKGYIQMIPGQSGRNMWVFSEKLGGSEILIVPPKAPHVQALAKHLIDPYNWKPFIATLRAEVDVDDEVNASSPLKFDPDDPQSVVQAGIEQGVIKFDPTQLKVFLFDGKHFQDKALRKIEDADNWKTELVDKSNKVMANRVLKLLS